MGAEKLNPDCPDGHTDVLELDVDVQYAPQLGPIALAHSNLPVGMRSAAFRNLLKRTHCTARIVPKCVALCCAGIGLPR